jgi:hypothetical protein
MKALFGSLLCLVLGASGCFAISGGPVYPAGTKIVGHYAGVLQGVFDPTNPASSNSVGIFSLGIPTSGLTTGTFLMFAQGRVFTGNVQGSGSPVSSTLQAILTATFNYTLHNISSTGEVTDISVTASVNGTMRAAIQAAKSSSLFGTSATLLLGNATLNIDQGGVASTGIPILTGVLSLRVNGFKQSDTA